MRFVGVDLTSAFARRPRPIDVAILDDGLHVTFSSMTWPSPADVTGRNVKALQAMLAAGVPGSHEDVVWAIDGPQGLALSGRPMRSCERQLGTPGRTPHVLPPHESRAPFQGYIRASVDLFAVMLANAFGLRLAGSGGSTAANATLFEVFPGAEWSVLAGRRVPGKATREGREQRRQLLEHLGVNGLPACPMADQNDALVGAYLAWCTRREPDRVALVGLPPVLAPPADLCEGHILHATSAARVTGWSPVTVDGRSPSAQEGRARLPSVPIEEVGEDWAGDVLELKFTDTGLVHGQEPENAWLVAGHDYSVEIQQPYRNLEVRLTWSRRFAGGLGWKVEPSVRRLISRLESEIETPSRSDPLSVPVMVK